MTRCLCIRDLENTEDILNMFGQKTELRCTRFGVKFREIARKKQAYFASFFKNLSLLGKSLFNKG